ncbi:uncharacterized protein C6orf118 isoform X1 [Lepisosteus oculatus]|uniref:uncharacterized protein C6orf118 isoform X1 n=1 Tax=Lepisosteus oculatus TaxID=7918 RepID=UPI0035F517B6
MWADQEERKLRSNVLSKTRKELLQGLEKAHKADILAYSSGHLNHDNLCKLPVQKANGPIWESSKTPDLKKTLSPRRLKTSEASVRRMKDALMDFTVKTASVADRWRAQTPRSEEPCLSAAASASHLQVDSKDKLRGSLDPAELLLVKPPGMRSDGTRSAQNPDCYQLTQSHHAGLTKKEQFRLMQELEKVVLKKQDMKERHVLSGHKAAEHLARKLDRELKKLSSTDGPSYSHLKVFSDIFSDVCNGSQVFGELLKEIKMEYDFYLNSLLESQPALQLMPLVEEIQRTQSQFVMTQDVELATEEVLRLGETAKRALEENEQLRNELQIEVSKPGSLDEKEIHKDNVQTMKHKEITLCTLDHIQHMRYQVWAAWEEVRELEREIKEKMVSTITTGTTERCIRDSKAEVMKLLTSNEHLQQATKDLENGTSKVLGRMKVPDEVQKDLWNKIKTALKENDGLNSQ